MITKPSGASTVKQYIDQIDEPRKSDVQALHRLIQNAVPTLKPFIQSGMIGYGKHHYKSKSCEGDWFKIGLASQKNYISVYVCAVESGKYLAESYKDALPKANIGRSCVRFKRLEDIDSKVLTQLVKAGAKAMR